MTKLETVQEAILGALQAEPSFSGEGIRFIGRHEGQLLNDIDAGRAQLVLACFVYPPVPASANANLAGPVFDRLQVRVTWFENHELREPDALHAEAAAIRTMQTLHHYGVAADGLHLISVQEDGPLEWSLTKQGLQQWDCWFNVQWSLPKIDRVPRPVIDYDAATDEVTITCADTNAAIWYTTDGSFPHPENDAAAVYGAPFSAGSSAEVRAIGIRDGFTPSSLASLIT